MWRALCWIFFSQRPSGDFAHIIRCTCRRRISKRNMGQQIHTGILVFSFESHLYDPSRGAWIAWPPSPQIPPVGSRIRGRAPVGGGGGAEEEGAELMDKRALAPPAIEEIGGTGMTGGGWQHSEAAGGTPRPQAAGRARRCSLPGRGGGGVTGRRRRVSPTAGGASWGRWATLGGGWVTGVMHSPYCMTVFLVYCEKLFPEVTAIVFHT
jgi:hypothetical protein